MPPIVPVESLGSSILTKRRSRLLTSRRPAYVKESIISFVGLAAYFSLSMLPLITRRSPLPHAMPIVERVSDRDICRSYFSELKNVSSG
ncbi:MAG: hypothetical protein WBA57_10815 [Elainellaceae cyanobacterium]